MKKVLSVVCALALLLCAIPFGIVSAATGTEADPIEIQAIDTIETDGSGEIVYYVYNAPAAGEYKVTITGANDSFSVTMNHPMTGFPMQMWAMNGVISTSVSAYDYMMNQIVLPIADMEAQTLTVSIELAIGTYDSPDTLVIGENLAKNPDNDFYYYTWTATESGTLTFTMPESNWSYNGYVIKDPLTYDFAYFTEADTMTSADETVVNPFSVDVMAGEEVCVKVQTLPDANNWGAVTAGEVAFTAAFEACTGAQDDPIPVKNGNVVTVGAGETKYYSFTDTPGLTYDFNVTGATGFEVGTAHPMMGYMMNNPDVDGAYVGQLMTGNSRSMTPGQAIFTITNHTEEAQEYALSIILPIGTMENPEELVLGETTYTSQKPGTYYYTWTAEDDGTFTFMVNEEQCTNGWSYSIVHGESLESHTSKEGSHFADYSVDVAAGDVLSIQVSDFDMQAGETTVFTTNFITYPGTQGNPYPVEDGDVIAADGSYETVYYVFNAPAMGEYKITVEGASDAYTVVTTNSWGWETEVYPTNGKASFVGVAQMRTMNQVIFGIRSEEAQDLTISIKVAVGTHANPDTLLIGENIAENPDNDYYYYTWTAEEDGKLTITMPESNWAYNGCVIDSETLVPVYFADLDMTSADETVVNPFTVEVKAGDEVRVMVQTQPDAENWGAVYAGEVAFNVAFAAAAERQLGDVNGDGIIDIADASDLFRAVNGRIVLSDEDAAYANVNGDEIIDISDASTLFRFINGRITGFTGA